MLKREPNHRSKADVQIPCMMWTRFFESDRMLTLAYYVQCRALYKHPILYNTSKKDLAKKLNISINTLKFHLDILVKEGIVEFRDGHIHLGTIKKLRAMYPSKASFETGKNLTLKTSKDFKLTKMYVKAPTMVASLKNIDKQLQKSIEVQKLKNGAEGKDLGSAVKKKLDKYDEKNKTKQGKMSFGMVCISNKGIANKVGCVSSPTGRKYRNAWAKAGLFSFRRRFRVIHENEYHLYEDGAFGLLKGAFPFGRLIVRETPCQFKLPGQSFYSAPKKLSFIQGYSKKQLLKISRGTFCSGTVKETKLTCSKPDCMPQ